MRNYLIILLLISPLFGFGQYVPEDVALRVAKNFFTERQQHFLKKTSSEISFIKKLKNQPSISENFHIFNTDIIALRLSLKSPMVSIGYKLLSIQKLV